MIKKTANNADIVIENFFKKMFEISLNYNPKPKIKGGGILGNNEKYKQEEANTPDFSCKLDKRIVIFEVFNASELSTKSSHRRLQQGKAKFGDITQPVYHKIKDKLEGNFNHINLDFKYPIVLIINTDQSSIDPIMLGYTLITPNNISPYVMQNINRKELISSIIITKLSPVKIAYLYQNPFVKEDNGLNNGELSVLEDIFIRNNFKYYYQTNEDIKLAGIDFKSEN